MRTIHEGSSFQNELGFRWEKACDCVGATASIGELRTSVSPGPTPDTVTLNASMIPGPSCDRCEKPWREAYRVRNVSYTAEDGTVHNSGSGILFIDRTAK